MKSLRRYTLQRKVIRMTVNERKEMLNLADIIMGEINRMCVTNELSELAVMSGHAKKNIEKLYTMIYETRFR